LSLAAGLIDFFQALAVASFFMGVVNTSLNIYNKVFPQNSAVANQVTVLSKQAEAINNEVISHTYKAMDKTGIMPTQENVSKVANELFGVLKQQERSIYERNG